LRCLRLTALLLLAALATPAEAEPSVTVLPLGFEVEQLRGPSTRVAQTATSIEAFRGVRGLTTPLAAVWGRDGAAVLTLDGDQVRITRAPRGGDLTALERGRDALPEGRVAGTGALSAQLEVPARDYAHEALGSPVQARVLAVTERKPSPPTSDPKPVSQDVARIPAGEGAVFEDREPRLVDLDGPAILVVRSYRDRGSALAVVAKREGTWRVAAETPPDGEPFRWLNPVAAGERAARRDLALVRRPHLDGLLQIWRLDGEKLILRAEKAGYSNHAFGSAAQDLAVWYVAEGGGARLAVPILDRSALAILEVGPEIREIGRIPLPAKVKSGVTALGRGQGVHLLAGLEDGRLADIRP
jgi:hypothetical protein